MDSLDSYKIFGLLSVILSWMAIGVVLLGQPRDVSKSISHHAAQRDRAYKVFALLMTGSVVLMFFFIVKWLVPVFRLSDIAIFISTLAVLLELITTWIPLTEGKKYIVHHLCSNGAALLIPVILLFLAFSPGVSDVAAAINSAAIVTMLALCCLFVVVPRTRRHYLWYQSFYILVFHTSLMAVSYLS